MADFEAAKIVHQDHLLLDQPLLRLPFELLRKNFRYAHYIFEKESTATKNLLKETATGSLNGRSSPEDVLKNLDTMINKMRGLKRKLAACADEEERLNSQLGARARHLSELSGVHTVDDVKYQEWSRRRLDRLLVDYLLRHGHDESAKELADKKHMRELVDIETFETITRIKRSLEDQSVTEALAWCNENKKELRKMESKLEFDLRYQQYIELVRSESTPKLLEAIAHSRKYLVPHLEAYPREVRQAAGLLAYPPSRLMAAARSGTFDQISDFSDYYNLYSKSRWDQLASHFVTTYQKLLGLPSAPLLHIALSSGLSALKTPACHSSSHDANTKGGSSVCPVCSMELNELARAVPYAHHSKSHVEHDLMLLPNGRVYGRDRLLEYAAKSGLEEGKVKDLVTGEEYDVDKLKKVFIT